jgi:hypothetical protein
LRWIWTLFCALLFSFDFYGFAEGIPSPEPPKDTSKASIVSTIKDSLKTEVKSNEIDTVKIDSIRQRHHSPSGAMWRSLLFPGWGQLYNRKYFKALIIGGGEIGFISGIYIQHQRFKDAREKGDEYAANFYRNDRNRLGWWLAGLILYSMADAYVDAQLWDFEISQDLSWKISFLMKF